MPSKRMIHPSFWESESISRYTMFERLFFAGLFSTADDQGRHKAHPVFLRSRIFPYDEIPLDEINDALDRFEYDGRIIRYEIDGKRYLQLVNWWTWQRLQYPQPSKYPAPTGWHDRVKRASKAWHWRKLRHAILKRDKGRCRYCGAVAKHVDHIVPQCQGGTDKPSNLVAACAPCNLSKGGRTPAEAGMELH